MAKQTVLSGFHTEKGAAFCERDGWLLPAHFGDPGSEYRTVRSAVGFSDLSHRALLQVTGADRAAFLQGMVSNDLQLVETGGGQYAAFLNQQGKVLGDVRVLRSDNSIYLDLWDCLKDKIITHLERYRVADEVEFVDRSGDYGLITIQGPRSPALLQALFNRSDLPERFMQHVMVDFGDEKVCVVYDSHTGEPGFDIFIANRHLADLARHLTEIGAAFSAAWVGEQAQEILRLETGIPRYGIDFNEDNLLMETDLRHAVSFSKGCYLGQEVVERIRSRGHINKKLMGLVIDGVEPQRPGTPVVDGDRDVGHLTSSTHSPALGRVIALAYIHKDYWLPGSTIRVGRDGKQAVGTIAELPFIKDKIDPRSSA